MMSTTAFFLGGGSQGRLFLPLLSVEKMFGSYTLSTFLEPWTIATELLIQEHSTIYLPGVGLGLPDNAWEPRRPGGGDMRAQYPMYPYVTSGFSLITISLRMMYCSIPHVNMFYALIP